MFIAYEGIDDEGSVELELPIGSSADVLQPSVRPMSTVAKIDHVPGDSQTKPIVYRNLDLVWSVQQGTCSASGASKRVVALSPYAKTAIPSVHSVGVAPTVESAVLNGFVLVVDEWLSWPVACDVNTCSWRPDL